MSRSLRAWLALSACVLFAPSAAAAEGDLVKLMPKDTMACFEVRNPSAFFTFFDTWSPGAASGLFYMLPGGADLKPEEFTAEFKKTRGLAVAVTGINKETQIQELLVLFDVGDSKVLKELSVKAIAQMGDKPAAVVKDIRIFGENGYGFLSGNLLVAGSNLETVKGIAERLQGGNDPGLDSSERFKKAAESFDKNAIFVAFADASLITKYLTENEAHNDDFAMLNWALDLRTVESATAEMDLVDGHEVARLAVNFSGPNRTYAALRMAPSMREAAKFFPGTYGVVGMGRLTDGREQWLKVRNIMTKFEDMGGNHGFTDTVTQLEEKLETNFEDEFANITEYAWGVRTGDPQKVKTTEVVIALKMTEPARAVALMRNVEAAAIKEVEGSQIKEEDADGVKVKYLSRQDAEEEYAYALVDGFLLLSNHKSSVVDALRTWKDGKSILDERGAKDVLARLHGNATKTMLVNPMGLIPPMPRNPNAPALPYVGATTLETDDRVELWIDISGMMGIVRNVGGMTRMWGE